MTTRASSSRGRGRGRGKNPIISTGPSTLDLSGNQSGHSSQNTHNQIKQAKSDYAFPIQTLLAFQEQGLTNLPSRTWASIAEDSDHDLPALDLAIQTQKSQQLQIKPKSQVTSAQNQSNLVIKTNPIAPAQTQYVPKESFFFVAHIEPEFWDENPNKIPPKIFPPQSHFLPFTPNKTQKFYEFILIDTESISLKHYRDPKDDAFITHSTLQILNILTPSAFGPNPNSTKKFSQLFDPMGYNYWDYIKAWDYIILGLQNKSLKHSWLIYFKKKTKYSFPNWFLQWWDFFGPCPEIFPTEVQEGFQVFSKRFNKDLTNYPITLNFYATFSLSWIFSWQYKTGYFHHPKTLLSLYKQGFVKWWPRFDASAASPAGVTNWFKTNPKALQVADPETCKFLNQKARITAALAASTSEDDILEKLQNVMKLLHDQSSAKDAPSSSKKDNKMKQILVSSSSSSSPENLSEEGGFDYYSDDLC